MSREYLTKEAYSAAENRLLDMLSPRAANAIQSTAAAADNERLEAGASTGDEEGEQNGADALKVTSPSAEQPVSPLMYSIVAPSRRRQSTRRRGVRAFGVHCPLDPAVDSEVHLISSESDVSNMSDEDFKGFSDVDDDGDDEEQEESANSTGVFGVGRQNGPSTNVEERVDTVMDSVQAHDHEQQLANEEPINTSPKQPKHVEIPPRSTSAASVVSSPIPATAEQQLYAFENNIIDIYTEQTSDYSTTDQPNSGDNEEPCEIILNNAAYTIQTFVTNASQQCILYDNTATLEVENDEVCIVEVPYSPGGVGDVAVENNGCLQFTTAPNNLCIVNDAIGMHDGNHLALAQVAIGSQSLQPSGHEQCLITTDGGRMVNAQNLFYGVSDVSSDQDVIILTDEVVEPISEVYMDDIIEHGDEEVLAPIDDEEDDMCVDPYSDVTLEDVDAIMETTEGSVEGTNVMNIEHTTPCQAQLSSQPADESLAKVLDPELPSIFVESTAGCVNALRVSEEEFLNIPCAAATVTDCVAGAAEIEITEVADANTAETKIRENAAEPMPGAQHLEAMSVQTDSVNEDCGKEAVVRVVEAPAVVNTVVCEPTPKAAAQKCSTSTTTEFPNSSNSNQLCSGDEPHNFPTRMPLLKNTLSAEALDRKLATICQANPQPTIEEKIDSWNCNGDFSDVEDVSAFDSLFVNRESTRSEQRADSTNAEVHDFMKFQEMLVNNLQRLKDFHLEEQPHDQRERGSLSNLQAKAQRMLQKRQATDTLSSSTADNQQRYCTTFKHLMHAVGGGGGGGNGNSSSDFTHKPDHTVQPNSSSATLVPMPSKPWLRKASQCKPTAKRTMDTQTPGDEDLNESQKESVATSTTDLVMMQPHTSACRGSGNAGGGGGGVYVPMSSNAFQLAPHNTPYDAHNMASMAAMPSTSAYAAGAVVSLGYNYNIPPPPFVNRPPCDAGPAPMADQMPTSTVSVPQSSMPPMTSRAMNMPENRNNEAFYQQHEFCNYLGLTGLATANAVAIAMQELANSSIARRSLRVRSQQQLERMRIDFSRSRKRAESKPAAAVAAAATSAASTARVTAGASSSCEPLADRDVTSTTTAVQVPVVSSGEAAASTSAAAAKVSSSELSQPGVVNIICKISKNTKENKKSAKLYDYLFNGGCEHDKQLKQPQTKLAASPSAVRRKTAGESAAKKHTQRRSESADSVASSPPLKTTSRPEKRSNRNSMMRMIERPQQQQQRQQPSKRWPSNQLTTEHLHERIQQRLKRAREVKPAIYIVQSMNNDRLLKVATPPMTQLQVPHPSLEALKRSSQSDEIFVNEYTRTPEHEDEHENEGNARQAAPATSPSVPVPPAEPEPAIVSMSQICSAKMGVAFKRPVQRLRTQNDSRMDASRQQRKQQKSSVRARSKSSPHGLRSESSRVLVTRMTTNMNSKQLRSRKISLLKSYCLVDEARGKRLSGGTSIAAVSNAKSPKKNRVEQHQRGPELTESKHAAASSPTTESSRAQRELELKKKKLTKSTNQRGGRANAGQDRSPQNESPKKQTTPKSNSGAAGGGAIRKKPLRPISPATPTSTSPKKTEASPSPAANQAHPSGTTPRSSPVEATTPKRYMDITRQMDAHEFITCSSIVCPPAANAASRRLMRSPTEIDQNVPMSPVWQSELHTPPLRHAAASSPSKQAPSPGARNKAGECDLEFLPGIARLTIASPAQRNPLLGKHGKVLYIYYEQDVLIVVQEKLVSFWKYSKIFSVLRRKIDEATGASIPDGGGFDNDNDSQSLKSSLRSSTSNYDPQGKKNDQRKQDWVHLGRARRVTNDVEVETPYTNRICVSNSTPLYLELRCRQLDHNRREGKLLSTYVNIYYYNEDDLRPKMHSVHLDAVPGECSGIMYTTITESRYIVMAWPQETMLGKIRTGLCKYSLMPTLDTLASIREFKNMKHAIRYIECLGEDKLIGYGTTRISIWDHRSGDTVMCYDLCMELGRNLGAMYYPSLDIGQSSLLVVYQHIKNAVDATPELKIIACEVSSTAPSHRVLQVHKMPTPEFNDDMLAVNTGDHLILRSRANEEIWISGDDPQLLTFITVPGTQRFYSRNRCQVVELGKKTLTVDSIANHMLKLASAKLHQANVSGSGSHY